MEIKMVRCPNGHYYNAALHNTCPECSGKYTPTESVGSAGIPTYGPTEAVEGSSGIYDAYGKTMPVDITQNNVDFQHNSRDDFQRTSSVGNLTANGTEPVVGWLVCIEGINQGIDYRIHAGYNYIGREAGDVQIREDAQISRQNHAMVAYDSSERLYYVGPSTGRNLIKVNGKAVIGAVEIHNYDVISIGSTKLLFIALCGDRFGWEESGNV